MSRVCVLVLGAVGCSSSPRSWPEREPMPVRLAVPTVAVPVDPCAGLDVADGFDFPVGAPDGQGYVDAQPFGGLVSHLGADLNAVTGGNTDYGDPVTAVAHGRVVDVTEHGGGWGLVVRVVHRTNEAAACVESLYAHLADSAVVVGESVARGDRIGRIGDAGGVYAARRSGEGSAAGRPGGRRRRLGPARAMSVPGAVMESTLAQYLESRRRRRDAQLTPTQRARQALLLGLRAARIFASANGVTLREARDELRRRSQRGRVPSAVASR